MTSPHRPAGLPVSAVVVVVAVTDIKLTVGAQDVQGALLMTQTASIDITVAAHHRQTVRILLIGSQGKTRANHNAISLPGHRGRGPRWLYLHTKAML